MTFASAIIAYAPSAVERLTVYCVECQQMDTSLSFDDGYLQIFQKKNFNNLSTYSDISQINRLGYITERPSDYSTPHPPKSHSLPTTSRLNGNPAEGTGRGLDGVDR